MLIPFISAGVINKINLFIFDFIWRDALRRVRCMWDDTEVAPPLFVCARFGLSGTFLVSEIATILAGCNF